VVLAEELAAEEQAVAVPVVLAEEPAVEEQAVAGPVVAVPVVLVVVAPVEQAAAAAVLPAVERVPVETAAEQVVVLAAALAVEPAVPVVVLAVEPAPVAAAPAVAEAMARRGRRQTARPPAAESWRARPALVSPQAARHLVATETVRPTVDSAATGDLVTGRGPASWRPRPPSGRSFAPTS
jgi:hypothetical protein